MHITLRSDLAFGSRSLLRHRPLILRIVGKASRRFHVRVYKAAICRNHLHFLIREHKRSDLQNFFRVVAGHIAQEILREFPLPALGRGGAAGGSGGQPQGLLEKPAEVLGFVALLAGTCLGAGVPNCGPLYPAKYVGSILSHRLSTSETQNQQQCVIHKKKKEARK